MESFAKKSEQSNGLIASAASSSKSSASASPAKAPSAQAAAAAAAAATTVQNPVPVSLVVSYYYIIMSSMRWVFENRDICVHVHISPESSSHKFDCQLLLHYYEFHEVGVWESEYLCACAYQPKCPSMSKGPG